MDVRYVLSVSEAEGKLPVCSGTDHSVLQKATDHENFIREIYFWPSDLSHPVWVRVIGHEKASRNEAVIGRLWRNQWALHVCVNGRGYCNGQKIERGDCFISWPDFVQDIKVDPEDPLEFYWVLLRGREVESFTIEHGFRPDQLIFKCDGFEEIAAIIELEMNTDFSRVDIYEHMMAFVKLIFSYHKRYTSEVGAAYPVKKYNGQYVIMAKQLLYDHNYSVNIEHVAKKIGLDAKYFSKLFHRETGETLRDYVKRKRLKLSQDLMTKGIPPKRAAEIVGYSTYASFYRAFTKAFLVSPMQFMRGIEIGSSEHPNTK